jgi:DNA-binding transcriptional LysR family regulator
MQDLNEMAIFAIVVNTGSFTKAADKLKLPKSTVSRKVSQLEKRVGVRLINRTTRNLKPTETGKLYYTQCLKMLEQADEADRIVSNMQSEPSGLLRISTPLSFGTPFFINAIKRFLDKYPKVNIEIIADNKQVDLLEHEVDIAFRIGPLSDSSLIARNLGTARLSLVATPGYIAANGAPESLKDLEHHTCISHPVAPWIFQTPAGMVEFHPGSRMIANDMEMIRKMVKEGFGIGAVPQILISDDLQDQSLVTVLPEFPFQERTFYLVYPSRREPPSKVVAFTDFIFSNCQPVAPWEILASQCMPKLGNGAQINGQLSYSQQGIQTN